MGHLQTLPQEKEIQMTEKSRDEMAKDFRYKNAGMTSGEDYWADRAYRSGWDAALAAQTVPGDDVIAIAAQLWCEPKHSSKEMDVEFGQSIAAALTAYGNARAAEAYEDAAMKLYDASDHCDREPDSCLRCGVQAIRALKAAKGVVDVV